MPGRGRHRAPQRSSCLDDEISEAPPPIVILGSGPEALHHGALGIARSAGRLGIPVHFACRGNGAPAISSRYCRGVLELDCEGRPAEAVERLKGFAEKMGRAVLIPVDDAASVFVDRHAEQLAGALLFPRPPAGVPEALASKRDMHELCLRHGVPTPRSLFPGSEGELLQQAGTFTYPVVVKCVSAADAPAPSARVLIAADEDELRRAYRAMEVPHGANVMIQEYIPGGPETIWMFNGYFDSRSECLFGLTGRKIRQSPPYTGATTLGVCLANPAVHDTTVRLMKSLGYRGILDIGYRYDARDGLYKLLDANPRIGATFRLFVAADGMDVLRAMYLDLTGRPVPAAAMREGRRWVVEHLDLLSSITYARRDDLTLRAWARSLRGVQEGGWFATDDPLPFIELWRELLVHELARRGRAAVLARLRRRRGSGLSPGG